MEPVLRYRKQLEDEARQKLFQSLEEEAAAGKALMAARNKLRNLYEQLAAERSLGTTVDRLQLFENSIPLEQKKIQRLEEELEKKKEAAARRRRHLLQASQEKKALEKLKERQNRQYTQYLEKREAAMLDEIAVLRHGRNR